MNPIAADQDEKDYPPRIDWGGYTFEKVPTREAREVVRYERKMDGFHNSENMFWKNQAGQWGALFMFGVARLGYDLGQVLFEAALAAANLHEGKAEELRNVALNAAFAGDPQ